MSLTTARSGQLIRRMDYRKVHYFVNKHSAQEIKDLWKYWGYKESRHVGSVIVTNIVAIIAITILITVTVIMSVNGGLVAYLLIPSGIGGVVLTAVLALERRKDILRILETINLEDYSYVAYKDWIMESLSKKVALRANIGMASGVDQNGKDKWYTYCHSSDVDIFYRILTGSHGLQIKTEAEAVLDKFIPFALECTELREADSITDELRQQLKAEYESREAAVVDELMVIYSSVQALNTMRAEQLIQMNKLPQF